MKRVFIIHGWEGHPEEGWRPWLRKELENLGFQVQVPAMPDTDHPKMGEWLDHLSKVVGEPDGSCHFIGHSLGCITILRYLGTIKKQVAGAIIVAGFSDNLGYQELNSFFEDPIDWINIRHNCRKFIAINSDDDPYVPVKHGDIFREKLGAELIIANKMKHFSGDDGITELPVVLEKMKEFT
jgi:predicted alpha/beta hydrolase family esterase